MDKFTSGTRCACIEHLRLAGIDLERAMRLRDMYVELAHSYGLTDEEIGEALQSQRRVDV